jgi:SAM-dependent methyltransferase
MRKRVPSGAGDVYGRVLAYLDATTLATWSESSGLRLLVSRWYARVFGFPELAAHRRFGPIRKALRLHGGSKVLDLGAGNGLYSVADGIGRPESAHFLADISRRHMRRATATGQTLGLPIWGITCSAEALPLATESVDSVLLIEVLQFIDDDAAAIKEIARVLRPGGMWLCEQDRAPVGTTLVWTPEARLRKRRVGYTAEALCKLAASVGLVLDGSRMVSGPVSRWWESIDGRIFRMSRGLHYILFPLVHLVAWLSTPVHPTGDSGTVLYAFRKLGTGGRASFHAVSTTDD